jgi:hypothetical protein
MSSRNRLHREDPARTGPIRDFTNLYRRPEVDNASQQQESEAKSGQATNANDPLSRGVEIAYKVIDQYFTEGRRTAEQLNSQTYTSRFAGDSLQGLVQRMLRYQGDLIPLWLEIVSGLVKADPGRFETRDPSSANGMANSQSNQIAIELVSKRSVRVRFELRENRQASELASAGLHAVEAGKPPLTDVKLVPDTSGRWSKIQVTIPDDHPAGTYSGVITERKTGEIRGMLSIHIDG